jgi:hypothetical protein
MREYLQDAYMEFEEEFLLKIIEKKADPKEPTKEEWIKFNKDYSNIYNKKKK